MAKAKHDVDELVKNINKQQAEENIGGSDKERYVIPPHLHDLQEADLPETQRGLVISEIALFRERAAKREREKMKELPISSVNAPSGPKQRDWGKPQPTSSHSPPHGRQGGFGKGAQGYNKPVGFVRAEEQANQVTKTDEELEQDRREARRRDEENSFRDVRFPIPTLDCMTLTSGRSSENVDMNLVNGPVSKPSNVPLLVNAR